MLYQNIFEQESLCLYFFLSNVLPDFLSQDALRTFSPGNRTKFIDNAKLAPVLTHMYTAGAIDETQLQRIESERTNIDKANHLWNLMTTQQRYLDGVREALTSTGQKQLAGILI